MTSMDLTDGAVRLEAMPEDARERYLSAMERGREPGERGPSMAGEALRRFVLAASGRELRALGLA